MKKRKPGCAAWPGRVGICNLWVFLVFIPSPQANRATMFTGWTIFKERKDFANYLQLFEDAGWERVGEFNNWQYFRTHNTGDVPPEIFSDPTSKILKYRRVMNGLLAFQPIFIIMIIFARSGNPIYPFIAAIGMATMIIIGMSIIMLYRRINQLKK